MNDLKQMLEDLEELTDAVVEFRKATAFLEADQRKEEWPKEQDSGWIDSAGTVFDPEKHAVNRRSRVPAVTSGGTFRKRRST